jgi:hypothetical protein
LDACSHPAPRLDGQHGLEQRDQLRVLRVQDEPVVHGGALEGHGSQREALPGQQPVHAARGIVTKEGELHLVLQQPRLVAWAGVAAVRHAHGDERVRAALQQAALHVQGHVWSFVRAPCVRSACKKEDVQETRL